MKKQEIRVFDNKRQVCFYTEDEYLKPFSDLSIKYNVKLSRIFHRIVEKLKDKDDILKEIEQDIKDNPSIYKCKTGRKRNVDEVEKR